jgi:uncharacterized membrane protein YgdD (TMEM256/DUF423 family)
VNARTWVIAGACLGFVTVAAGAFGAHGLKARLEPAMLEVFQTGVRYGMVHALALVLLGLLAARAPSRAATVAGVGFASGVLLFTGSLCVLAVTGVKALGMITPFGGLAFLVGWVALAVAARKLPTL